MDRFIWLTMLLFVTQDLRWMHKTACYIVCYISRKSNKPENNVQRKTEPWTWRVQENVCAFSIWHETVGVIEKEWQWKRHRYMIWGAVEISHSHIAYLNNEEKIFIIICKSSEMSGSVKEDDRGKKNETSENKCKFN